MKKTSTFLSLLVVLFGLLKTSFAEVQTQKDGLFTIDTPQAWTWIEDENSTLIQEPKKKASIRITIRPVSEGVTEEEMKANLKLANEQVIKLGVEPNHGAVIAEKETQINGAYARQLEYTLTAKDQKPTHVTHIAAIYKANVYTFSYGNSEDSQGLRAQMEKAVATFKFTQ